MCNVYSKDGVRSSACLHFKHSDGVWDGKVVEDTTLFSCMMLPEFSFDSNGRKFSKAGFLNSTRLNLRSPFRAHCSKSQYTVLLPSHQTD